MNEGAEGVRDPALLNGNIYQPSQWKALLSQFLVSRLGLSPFPGENTDLLAQKVSLLISHSWDVWSTKM